MVTRMCEQTGVSLLERDTRDMVDHLQYIALFCIPTQFSSAFCCFKTITQLLDSDWPNIWAGSHFRAQENGPMSPDSVCTIICSAGPAGHETNFSWRLHPFLQLGCFEILQCKLALLTVAIIN